MTAASSLPSTRSVEELPKLSNRFLRTPPATELALEGVSYREEIANQARGIRRVFFSIYTYNIHIDMYAYTYLFGANVKVLVFASSRGQPKRECGVLRFVDGTFVQRFEQRS